MKEDKKTSIIIEKSIADKLSSIAKAMGMTRAGLIRSIAQHWEEDINNNLIVDTKEKVKTGISPLLSKFEKGRL